MSNRNPITREHRATVARAWRLAQSRGETQASFCARQEPRIQPRTLRHWAKEFAPGEPPDKQVRTIIERAISDLQAVVTRFDTGDATTARHPASTPPIPGGTPTGSASVPPADPDEPEPERSFRWDD